MNKFLIRNQKLKQYSPDAFTSESNQPQTKQGKWILT